MAFFDELKKSFTDVSETLTKKSGEIVEVQKLKMKKSSLESDVKKNLAQLGQIYFQQMQESGVIDEAAEEFFQNIVDANEAIDEIKVKLEQMSKEKVCAVCGEKSPKTMAFCPHCGTKFETVAECSEAAENDCAEESAACDCEAAESCACEVACDSEAEVKDCSDAVSADDCAENAAVCDGEAAKEE